jgi:hypothetical protein
MGDGHDDMGGSFGMAVIGDIGVHIKEDGRPPSRFGGCSILPLLPPSAALAPSVFPLIPPVGPPGPIDCHHRIPECLRHSPDLTQQTSDPFPVLSRQLWPRPSLHHPPDVSATPECQGRP